MSFRAPFWHAWSLACISLAMFLASLALYDLAGSAQSPGDGVTVGTVSDMLTYVPILAFPLVGALIASRRPHNPIDSSDPWRALRCLTSDDGGRIRVE
jgi:hypothetical protein